MCSQNNLMNQHTQPLLTYYQSWKNFNSEHHAQQQLRNKTNKTNFCTGKTKKNQIKCVIVGDKRVGKTCLVFSYSTHKFPENYKPTAYDIYNVEVQVDQKPIRLELCDTAGEDSFYQLRDLSYPGTDVFILCFSVVKPSSFKSACDRWAYELNRFNATVVLVGTQSDLRNDPRTLYELNLNNQKPVSKMEAHSLAESLKAHYVETSAKDDIGLKQAFDAAITAAFMKKTKRKFWRRLCCV